MEGFDEAPLIGKGGGHLPAAVGPAAPLPLHGDRRPLLYVQVLSEYGLIGMALLGGALIAIGVGLARRMRGEEKQVYAAVLALAVVWAIHAGVDWDWEMPAVTISLFALAGLGLSKPRGERSGFTAAFEPGRLVRIVAAVGVGVLAVTPAAIAISQSRLDAAVADFNRNDCGAAIDQALGSLEALKVRPDPYEVIGYCDARLGQDRLALLQMRNAVSRDPDNWETHYGLALVQAAGGLNPLPQLYESHRLNPLETSVREAIARMRGKGPREWERRAFSARLPL